jgi:hypothetical protein
MEYWNGAVSTANNLYAYSGSSTPSIINPSGKSVLDAAGGFNSFKIITTDNLYYKSSAYNVGLTWTQRTQDTTLANLDDCIAVYAWADCGVIMRADSSLWMIDNDSVGIFHALGTQYIITKAIKFSQSGVKYQKVVIGGNGIYGLTNDGKIYLWARNSQTITPTTIYSGSPRPAIDITTATFDCFLAVIQNATGDPTCGHIFVKGNSFGDWGGTGTTYSSLTDIQSIYGVPYSVKKIQQNTNSFHFIDSVGDLYGVAKCNAQGELGNGVEYVNRYTYSTWPGYGWTFSNTENPVAAPAVKIHAGIKHKELYSGAFFIFYNMVTDSSDNCYVWGRIKTNVGFLGIVQNATDNANHPNACDTTKPAQCFPFTQAVKTANFVSPVLSAGTNQTISTSSTAVTATGNPMLLINASNSTDTLRTLPVTYLWTKISGSGTITSPTAKSTTITGLTTGVSVFQVQMTDYWQGVNVDQVTITATVTTGQINLKAGCRLKFSN